jgi:hypothetical protein
MSADGSPIKSLNRERSTIMLRAYKSGKRNLPNKPILMRLNCLYLMIPPAAILMVAFSSGPVAAEDTKTAQLVAPDKWTKETIRLPPGFARDMTFTGTEQVRFAPGMFKPESESFFSYVFAFELKKGTKVDSRSLNRELLKYYRGLSKAVLQERASKVDFSAFKLDLTKLKPPAKNPTDPPMLRGRLEWVEPFATKSQQTLHLELQTWQTDQHEIVVVCVSPRSPTGTDAEASPEIWKQMRKIRAGFRKKSLAKKDSGK